MQRAVLGTMMFGDTVSADVAERMLKAALDVGVAAVDTANVYAAGRSEELLGALLVGEQGNVALATKVGVPHPDADGRPPLSRDAILRCIEGSLRRLRRESVDLYYLHQPDYETPLDQTLAVLRELIEGGVIGTFGISNYAAWQLADICHRADALGMSRPAAGQQLYNSVPSPRRGVLRGSGPLRHSDSRLQPTRWSAHGNDERRRERH